MVRLQAIGGVAATEDIKLVCWFVNLAFLSTINFEKCCTFCKQGGRFKKSFLGKYHKDSFHEKNTGIE